MWCWEGWRRFQFFVVWLMWIKVVRLSPAHDFASNGRWEALIRDLKTNEERTEIFDAVLICTGHHADKHMPHFEGEENFKGKRIHTHDFYDGRGYDDKRVVVIGIGNSGGDVAVELSRICSQVLCPILINFALEVSSFRQCRERRQVNSLRK
jgi:cation diffusion facilitator CzcD-associated flavoprotein CzcO